MKSPADVRDPDATVCYGLRGWDYRNGRYRKPRCVQHPNDCSVMTYRGMRTLRTLIRCAFSPTSTTGGSYIYTGGYVFCLKICEAVLNLEPYCTITVQTVSFTSLPWMAGSCKVSCWTASMEDDRRRTVLDRDLRVLQCLTAPRRFRCANPTGHIPTLQLHSRLYTMIQTLSETLTALSATLGEPGQRVC